MFKDRVKRFIQEHPELTRRRRKLKRLATTNLPQIIEQTRQWMVQDTEFRQEIKRILKRQQRERKSSLEAQWKLWKYRVQKPLQEAIDKHLNFLVVTGETRWRRLQEYEQFLRFTQLPYHVLPLQPHSMDIYDPFIYSRYSWFRVVTPNLDDRDPTKLPFNVDKFLKSMLHPDWPAPKRKLPKNPVYSRRPFPRYQVTQAQSDKPMVILNRPDSEASSLDTQMKRNFDATSLTVTKSSPK